LLCPSPFLQGRCNYAQPNQNFYIGAYQGSCQLGYAGDVDGVRIFNRVLSAAEIHNVFAGAP